MSDCCRLIKAADPATTCTPDDLRTYKDNKTGIVKLFVPAILASKDALSLLVSGALTFLSETTPDTHFVKYVLYLLDVNTFKVGQKAGLAALVKAGLPVGLSSVFKLEIGNERFGTVLVYGKDRVCTLLFPWGVTVLQEQLLDHIEANPVYIAENGKARARRHTYFNNLQDVVRYDCGPLRVEKSKHHEDLVKLLAVLRHGVKFPAPLAYESQERLIQAKLTGYVSFWLTSEEYPRVMKLVTRKYSFKRNKAGDPMPFTVVKFVPRSATAAPTVPGAAAVAAPVITLAQR